MPLTSRPPEELRWWALILGSAVLAAAVGTVAAYVLSPLAVLAAALFMALSVVIYHRPAIGVGAGLLLIATETSPIAGPLSPTEGTMVAVALCYLARALLQPGSVVLPGTRELSLFALLSAFAAGLVVADDTAPIFRVFGLWVAFFLVYLQCQSFTPREIRGVLVAFAIGAGILGLIGTVAYLQSGGPRLYSGGLVTGARAAGAFSDPNYSASMLALAVVPAVALIVHEPRRLWWLGLMAGAAGAGVIFSLSRGGFLALMAGLGVLTMLWGRFRIAGAAFALVVLTFGLFNADPIVRSSQFRTVQTRLGTLTGPQLGATNLRPRIWAAAVDVGVDHPFFGVGVQNFQKAAAQRGVFERGSALENVHNIPLNLLAENGFIGLGGFLVFIAQLAWRARTAIGSRDRLARALALGLLATLSGFLVQGLTLMPLRVNAIAAAFFVVAGMLTALADRAARPQGPTSP